VRIEHLADRGTELQVRVSDDAGCDPAGPVEPGGAHRRDAVDELRLTDHAQMLRTVRAVHGAALDEDRRDDVMARVHVEQEVVEQVAMGDPLMAKLPEVVVRIADGQVRLERVLDGALEPGQVGG
jgi:hypothetical protein